MSEVKGRQRGGERKNGSGSAWGGRIYCSQSVPQSEAQAQPQAVTSAGSCAWPFALQQDWCAVWTTAGLKSSLTQTASLWINWPGILKGHFYLAHEILFERTSMSTLPQGSECSSHQKHTVERGGQGWWIWPLGFSHGLALVLRTAEEQFLMPPVSLLLPVLSLVSSSLTLQNSTRFQAIHQAPNESQNKIGDFAGFWASKQGAFIVLGDTVFKELLHKYTIHRVQSNLSVLMF